MFTEQRGYIASAPWYSHCKLNTELQYQEWTFDKKIVVWDRMVFKVNQYRWKKLLKSCNSHWMGKVAKVYLDDIGDKLVKENTKFYVEKEGKGMGYSYNVV